MGTPHAHTVIHGIGTLVTPARVPAPIRGTDLAAVLEIADAAIAVGEDGAILASGPEVDVRAAVATDGDTHFHDARGALAIPGLVDCHTHPVFAGDRAAEFELRNLGAGYEAIHAAGGGIRASVARTRAALDDGTIAPQVRRHLDWMLAAGTTTAECKSGYALTIEHELESLRVLQAVAADHPLRTTRTLLAAHTVPEEYDGRKDGRSRIGWGHSTYEEGAKIAIAAGVKRYVLFHHDPEQDDAAVRDKERRAQALFPESICAYEGLVLET